MSIVSAALVLLSLAALADADCLVVQSSTSSANTAVLSTTATTISYLSSVTVNCLPGYNYDGSGTTYSTSCTSSTISGTCQYTNPYWCPSTINDNFAYTQSVSTGKFPRSVGSTVYLLCKGRNVRGNGTAILVTCASTADGGSGVWVSTDWCSGALGVSANVALLALAAVAGLLYKRLL